MRAGLIAIALALAGCSGQKPEALVGAWRSRIAFSNGPFAAIKDLEFMYVFHADGTLTESSNYDASPPVPPAYGVWRKTEPARYEAHYEFYLTKPPASAGDLPNGWGPAGHGAFDETITVAADGRSFTSTLRYQGFDAAGQPTADKGEAKGAADRMTAGAPAKQ